MSSKIMTLDVGDICRRYVAGESELALSNRFKVDRRTIGKRLLEGGVVRRNASEANIIRMRRLSPAERSALASAAHDAVRGCRQSEEHRRKIALTRQLLRTHIGRAEVRLSDWLRKYGLNTIPQKAIGRYNVDVAITQGRIAVEIFGGCWHTHGSHARRFRKRTDYIINAGWQPVIVWVTRNYPLEVGAIDYLITLSNALGSNKSFRGQEHVIRGDGKVTGMGKANLNYRAAVGGNKTGNLIRGKDGRFTNQAMGM